MFVCGWTLGDNVITGIPTGCTRNCHILHHTVHDPDSRCRGDSDLAKFEIFI